MDTMSAFVRGQAAKGNPQRTFDWNRAAELIKERQPERAGAGLAGDWDYTGGAIYADGKPVDANDTYTYLSSSWATPELEIDGDLMDCWIYEKDSDGWGPSTYWPASALDILNG